MVSSPARALKKTRNLTVPGSGQIVTQLAQAGLVDEYQFMINPVAIGAGSTSSWWRAGCSIPGVCC
uniref:dihydrofolate reductase family protein n=1 Tax=Dinghuibacter silviterrae TaxID=1539049 RepID=UPI001062953D